MKITKRQELSNFLKVGNIKKAVQIAKKLDFTYSKEQIRVFEIFYECLTGKESFYKELKIDTDKIKHDTLKLLNEQRM